MKILGVTGCPTGIAHTFMAEEALKTAAQSLGCEIKVETNGAIGVENRLTAKDIKEADAIIIACDKKVEMERFNGKPVIETSVTDGINNAEKLIQRCLDGKAAIRKGNGTKAVAAEEGSDSFGHQIYKHLMNGVSHMLPLVVAGGVLVAISFLFGIYSFDPTSDQYNAFAALLKSVGGYSMGLMVPVLAAFIAQSISDKPGMLAGLVGGTIANSTGSGFLGGIVAGFFAGYFVLALIKAFRRMPRQLEGLKSIFIVPIISVAATGILLTLIASPCTALNEWLMGSLSGLADSSPILLGIIIGCMSAFDMGGPVNKAAYVTGTTLLAAGNMSFMAGVSAACITPPIIIALAATFCKNRFSEEDRTAALINYILGFTHITEGAIPFAAKNPLKVIPVLMAGSSISATLTYLCKINVPAPHGGFLILPALPGVNANGILSPVLWVGCIMIGSVIGAVLYVLVTPKVETKAAEAVEANTVESAEETKEVTLFDTACVKMNVEGKTKAEVIDEMVTLLDQANILNNKKEFKNEILKREELSSTGLGMGFAIPHAKTAAVKIPRVAVGISKSGFDFASEDGKPAYMIFMIATTDSDADLHLETLAKLSGKLVHKEFTDKIMNAKSKEEVVRLLKEV